MASPARLHKRIETASQAVPAPISGASSAWRDPAILAWGRRHNVAVLPSSAARRIALVEGDVLTVRLPPVDLVLAMNFSYWVFKERGRLRQYFRRAYAALLPHGIVYLDAYGGYEAFKVLKERTPYQGYTYV